MKFTNASANQALASLANCGKATNKVGYAIARNKRKLEQELTEFSDAIETGFKKYGEEVEPGQFKLTTDEAVKSFNEELAPIAAVEIDVDITKIEMDEQTFVDGGLTSEMLDGIWWMIDEGS